MPSFAFLSAFHIAALTDRSVEDDMFHLAAAMQFRQFRSVVGTIWGSVFSRERRKNGGSTSRRRDETAEKERDDIGALGELGSLR